MALTPNSAILPQTPRSAVAQIANSNGTNLMQLVAGGTNGSKVSQIGASNTDTNGYTLQLWRNIGGTVSSGQVSGGTNYLMTSVSLPASAGNVSGTAPIAVMNATTIPGIAVDNTGTPYLYVNSGEILCVALTSTITSGKLASATATVADF